MSTCGRFADDDNLRRIPARAVYQVLDFVVRGISWTIPRDVVIYAGCNSRQPISSNTPSNARFRCKGNATDQREHVGSEEIIIHGWRDSDINDERCSDGDAGKMISSGGKSSGNGECSHNKRCAHLLFATSPTQRLLSPAQTFDPASPWPQLSSLLSTLLKPRSISGFHADSLHCFDVIVGTGTTPARSIAASAIASRFARVSRLACPGLRKQDEENARRCADLVVKP